MEFRELSAGGADDEVVWRRSCPTTKWSDSKSLDLAIDASSGADSFKTEKLRLSAFQNDIFCATTESSDHEIIRFEIAISRDRRILRRWFLRNWKAETLSFPICYFLLNFDLRKASKQRFRIDTLNLHLRRKFGEKQCVFAFKTLTLPLRSVKLRLRR